MKKVLIIIAFFLIFKVNYATEISGSISSDMTLSASGNPYYVTSDLQVISGVTLTIEPGVELYFRNGSTLYIKGTLKAIGTASEKILFTKDIDPTGNFYGLIFTNTAVEYDIINNTGCILKYCILEKASSAKHLITCQTKRIMVDYCEIRNSDMGISLWNHGIYLSNSKIHHIQRYAIDCNSPAPVYSSKITGNEFFNNNDECFTIGEALIENNYFHDNGGQSYFLRIRSNCQIDNNRFVDNPTAVAVALLGGETHTLTNNHFINNKVNVFILFERHPIANNNCFESYVHFNIYLTKNVSGNPYSLLNYDNAPHTNHADIDFSNNNFYNLTNEQIASSIYDDQDNFAEIFTAKYLPVSTTACNPYTSIIDYDNDINIFPNPANNYLIINLQKTNDVIIELSDINGQLIFIKEENVMSLEKMDISNLPKGMYLLKIIISNKMKVEKIIKY